jgi:hypothetical protein
MTAPKKPDWLEAELDWYVNDREAAMGICAMPIEPSIGGNADHDGISDKHVDAATRARKIEKAMAILTPSERLLVQAVHARFPARTHRAEAQQKVIEAAVAAISVAVSKFRRVWGRR